GVRASPWRAAPADRGTAWPTDRSRHHATRDQRNPTSCVRAVLARSEDMEQLGPVGPSDVLGGVAEGKGAGHARWENHAVRVPPRKERGEAPIWTWRPIRLLPCGARAAARQLRPRLYRSREE